MHNIFAKGQRLQKIATGYWDQMTFHLLIQSKVGVQRGKGKIAQWTLEIFYANRLQILSRKSLLADIFSPFRAYVKLCFFTNWPSLVTKEFHSLLAFDRISIFLDLSFGFSIQEPFLVAKLLFLGFQLDLFFFFFIFFYFIFCGLICPFGFSP